jgi:hypothetical protein
MKKIILCLTFVSAACAAQAQNSTAEAISKKYRFGFYANLGSSGMKVTSLTTTGTTTYDVKKNGGRFATGIGLTGEMPLTESAVIYSGVGLDWYGGGITATNKTLSTSDSFTYAKSADVKYKLQALSIPIGLKLKASNINDRMFIYGRVGADVGFVIGRNADYTVVGRKAGSDTTIAAIGKLPLKTVTPLQVGWHFGAGVEYKIAKNAAFAEILYRNGLIDATAPKFRDASTYKFEDGNIRTNNISLRIGYFF